MKIIFLLIVTIQCVLAKEQSVRVFGRFMCHGKPAQYVELQLVSKLIIGGTAFARDVFTDAAGYFDISGFIDPSTWSPISARLYVWHRCFEKPYEQADPCLNWFSMEVPLLFVNRGPFPDKSWDIGEIDLKEKRDGQELDAC